MHAWPAMNAGVCIRCRRRRKEVMLAAGESPIAEVDGMSTSTQPAGRGGSRSQWRLLTNHGAVLVYLNARPGDTVRSMAAALALSERTVAAVVADLREDGYITVRRNGRRNYYVINHEMPLKRTFFPGTTMGDFLRPLKIPLTPPSATSD